jgi:hypothetical protein
MLTEFKAAMEKPQKTELKQWFAEHSFLSVAVLNQFPEALDSILDPKAGHSDRSLQRLS